MKISTVSGINGLAASDQFEIYKTLVPAELLTRFNIDPSLKDAEGNDLLLWCCQPGCAVTEMEFYHQHNFPDPVLYGHVTDTVMGHLQVLLYVLNDPDSPRFDVDRMPDGRSTQFGTSCRNIEAELAALGFGLAPGQIRRGLRMVGNGMRAFEAFAEKLGQDLYFIEPLYYHTAVIFERYGFAYEKGRRLMEQIHAGFALGGGLANCLDSSTPFRAPQAASSIRLRSWAIQDGILGQPFTGVAMYKRIGHPSQINTCPGCEW